jgi:hypothetical protein
VLERIHEDLVVEHGLVVSLLLLADLREEELLLDEGVVELSVGIAELVVLDEELESLSESGLAAVVLGERRHGLRVLGDEGGVEALRLEEAADQLVNEPDGRARVRAVDLVQLALLVEERLSLLGLDVFGQRHAEALLQALHHGDPSPGRGEVDF